ncbi:MAG: hypothetical protein KatS3mg077_3092 [Candidatus Binatia bacterium]|nr:MAG: hypothetical protein KatS3mg077_3092 [Candidatus Binatia bacterium]
MPNYEAAYATILPLVEKPGRYLGNEFGVVRKDPATARLRVALAFPDVYEIAQSHPGLQILYDLLNRRADVYAERVYAPWPDMEALLRQRNLPLVSLETFTPLCAFDVVGFTLQYELTYTNLLAMLDLGRVPLRARERDPRAPLIIAGGPCAFNPEPLAPFLDAVLLGDGEEAIHEICDVVMRWRPTGDRLALLSALSRIPGVYVPEFFEPKYSSSGRFLYVEPLREDYQVVRKRIVRDLDSVPPRERFLVPIVQVVHDRPSIEVMRGCVKGCRFCQAGYIYRPLRERSPRRVIDEAVRAAESTGQEEVSLLSLSTGDYSCVNPVLKELMDRLQKSRVAVSLPSTRVDALAPALLEQIRRVRKTGFTLAPEAGTQRLRDIIQKEYSEEELLEAARLIFELGWRHLKLYFMIGLPGETEDDLRGIAELCAKVRGLAPPGAQVVASVSNFVPKAHTPFQWMRQLSFEETVSRQRLLRSELQKVRVSFRYHDARLSVLEGVFSRGDRRLAHTLDRAFRLGCRFDGWTDQCRFDLWEQAFAETGVDVAFELRRRLLDESLPWDHLSSGVTTQFLQRELARAFERTVTPDCSVARCTYCGACDFKAVRNVDYHVKGSKASEHRGGLIRHWAAGVIGDTPDSEDWEPRGWKKVYRPDLLTSDRPLESPTQGPAGVAPPASSARQKPRHDSRELGTAEEWMEANGEGSLSAHVALEAADPKARIRLRYSKTGRARFVGAVELTNLFYRAVRRAQLPVAFTQGHHPLPKISFGPALPFGLESECEFADLYLTVVEAAETVRNRLNREMPSGIAIVDAWPVDMRAASLGKLLVGARYTADLSPVISMLGRSFALESIERFRASGALVEKRGGTVLEVPGNSDAVILLQLDGANRLTFEIRSTPGGTVQPHGLLQSVFGLTKEQVLALAIRKVAPLLATPSQPTVTEATDHRALGLPLS